MGKDSRAKTAFVTPFGKYEFLQVPFGLAQAPAYFQHLMNQVLDNCSFAMTYLDDIIIFSETEEQHLAHIEEIFKWLEAADLKMKRSKCDFFKKHIHYLGHLISADGIRPLKDKLDSIRDMPAPLQFEGSQAIPWINRILQKICTLFCSPFSTFIKTDM